MFPFLSPSVPFPISLYVSARLLPLYLKRAPLQKIVQLATPEPELRGSLSLTHDEITSSVKSVLSRPWRMAGRRCLREGVMAFHYLSLAGHEPVFHFAVNAASLATARPRAHCWISIDGKVVLNPPEPGMVEVFRYDASTPTPDTRLTSETTWT